MYPNVHRGVYFCESSPDHPFASRSPLREMPALLITFTALIHLPFLTAIVALLMLWLIRSPGANPQQQGFHDVAAGTIVLDK